MKILILVLILIIFAVLAYYLIPIIRSLQISKKIEAETKPFAQLNADAKFHILIAGDSTVAGTGARNPKDSIAGRFAKDYPDSEIINISENGLKTQGLREKLEKHLQKKTYDYIHIQIGANDITSFTKYGNLEKDLVAILDLVTEKADYVTILTAADVGEAKVFKYPLSKFISERTLVVRGIFKDTIDEYKNADYIDLYADRNLRTLFEESPGKYYAADMFHPNGNGYGEWYRNIMEVLNK